MKRICLLLLVQYAAMSFASAQSSPLNPPFDTAFNSSGLVIEGLGSNLNCWPTGLLLQPNDGKIVVTGFVDDDNGHSSFFVARFNSDGSQDYTFGNNGQTITSITSVQSDTVFGAALQADGKIVVAGITHNTAYGIDYLAVVRYTADGNIDSTFATDGIFKTGLGGQYSSTGASSVAIEADQKIVIGGYSGYPKSQFLILRLDTNGTPDRTFNGIGYNVVALDTNVDYAASIAIQQDQKIVAGGYSLDVPDGILQYALARFDTNGVIDNTFGTGGSVLTGFGINESQINALAIQNDQKIIAAGNGQVEGNPDFEIARFNTDGSLDTHYGYQGSRSIQFYTLAAYCMGVAIRPNGEAVLSGNIQNFDNVYYHNYAIAQVDTSGNQDVNFGSLGRIDTNINYGSSDCIGQVAIVQPDEKIVMVGAFSYQTGYDIGLIRYASDSILSTGIKSESGIDNISCQVYPNPFTSIVNLEFTKLDAGVVTLSVTDLLGRTLYLQKENIAQGTCKRSIDLSSLSSGSYFLQVSAGSETYVTKIFKL